MGIVCCSGMHTWDVRLCVYTHTQIHAPRHVSGHAFGFQSSYEENLVERRLVIGRPPYFVEKAMFCILLVCVWTMGLGSPQACCQAVNFPGNKSASGLFGLQWFTGPTGWR